MDSLSEEARAAALLDAQQKALGLFQEIERSLIRPGITESGLSREIHALAADLYGVRSHWHKRVIRTGPNTLQPYNEEPPDLTIQEDDILFVDLGPVFEAWEADFGRTYVLGGDPVKHRLRDDLEPAFREAKARFQADPDMTCGALYDLACDLAAKAGWSSAARSPGISSASSRMSASRATRRRSISAREPGPHRRARQGRPEAPLDPRDPSRRPCPADRRLL